MLLPILQVPIWFHSMLSITRFRWAGTLFLASILSPLWGAQGTEVVPSLIDGVTIEGPDSAGFHAQFLAIIPLNAFKDYSPLEPYSVRISNTSGKNIAQVIVRYDFLRKDGHPVYFDNGRQYSAGQRFLRGSTMIMAVPPAPLQNFAKSPYVRSSIDSVLFEDGEFAGPDVRGFFAKEKTHEQEIRSLIVQLNDLALGPQDQVLPRIEALRNSEATLHQLEAMRLKGYFLNSSSVDWGSRYLSLLSEMLAAPVLWRKQ